MNSKNVARVLSLLRNSFCKLLSSRDLRKTSFFHAQPHSQRGYEALLLDRGEGRGEESRFTSIRNPQSKIKWAPTGCACSSSTHEFGNQNCPVFRLFKVRFR